jgi:hypothetical protein
MIVLFCVGSGCALAVNSQANRKESNRIESEGVETMIRTEIGLRFLEKCSSPMQWVLMLIGIDIDIDIDTAIDSISTVDPWGDSRIFLRR